MLRNLAWLWLASLLVCGPAALAQNVARPQVEPVRAATVDQPSTDRHLAPNEFPTNVVKILRTTNKAQTNSYVPVVFTMNNVNPFSVIRFLHRPIQTEEGLLYTFVNSTNNGGKVLYAVPEYMIPSLRELVAYIDRPGLTTSSGDLRIYRQLKHRRAHGSDPDFLVTAGSFSTGNGSEMIADPETNALFWEDAPSGAQGLDNALTDLLDVPTAMLQLTVKIYELNAVNDAQVGLDYVAWKNGPGANLFALGAYSEHGGFEDITNATLDPLGTGARGLPRDNFSASGWNYAYQYNVPSAFFDFLAVKGKARILDKAKLAALNTRPAVIETGDQILYYDVAAGGASGTRPTGDPFSENDSRTVNSRISPRETGITLGVLPVIGEKTVQMDLLLEWSDFNGIDDNGAPVVNSRSLNTRVRCALGDEIIVGGLERQTRVQTSNKVPFLGSIPVLGYAFGGESTQAQKSEVVIAIQPIAVMNYDVATDYKVEEADKLVMDQAAGNEKVPAPELTWGFDMLGDPQRGVEPTSIDPPAAESK